MSGRTKPEGAVSMAEAAVKDSFWGTASLALQKAAAVAEPDEEHKDSDCKAKIAVDAGPAHAAFAAKMEPQPVTPKHSEPADPPPPDDKAYAQARPAPMSPEKTEGRDDVFEDDDDDLLPEAQPSFPRNEVDAAKSRFRQNAVHVYGLDFLKTGHMDEIFCQFNHKFVEWINDSSANIVFADAASTKKALESLSFPKTGDDPWRRTPDILVSEDVPPIFLQMRLAADTDVKPSKRGVPKASPAVHYTAGQRRDNVAGPLRRQMYSDDTVPEKKRQASTKRPTKAAISEEELLKRRKRAERFGEVQPTCGIEEHHEASANPATAPPPPKGSPPVDGAAADSRPDSTPEAGATHAVSSIASLDA